MKFSVMSMGFNQLFRSGSMTYKDFLDFCTSLKFDGVEPSDRHLRELDASKLSEWLKDLGLEIATVDIAGDFAQPQEHIRREAIESAKSAIELAHRLGSRQAMIVPGQLVEGTSLQDARRWAFEGLSECVDYCESIGIQATAENHGNPVSLRGSAKHLIEMVEKIPKLKLCYDVGNFLISGEDPLECLRKVISHVVHVHIKDFKYVDETHPQPLPWLVEDKRVVYSIAGDGFIDFRNVLKELKEVGYDGYLSIEYGDRGQMVKDGVAKGLENLKSILKKI